MANRNKKVYLNGRSLKLEEILEIIHRKRKVGVSPAAYSRMKKSKAFLDNKAATTPIYGVTTGFGPMASHIIGKGQMIDLQYNLVRSHATGVGEPISDEYVLAAMIVRLNTLVSGYSGVSPTLADRLALYINKRIIPVVPEHGAVGTSGDLVQLAHIALALIGEGEVFYQGKRSKTSAVLRKLKIGPYVLEKKEGLSLINGTSVMAGIAALTVSDTRKLLDVAVMSSALALELIHGVSDIIAKELHELRPHSGQCFVAKELRKILKSSKLLYTRSAIEKRVGVGENVCVTNHEIQNVYSFRCAPQIIGPIFDILEKVTNEVEIEINSVTDNPIVRPKEGLFLHGGNFHGDYISTAMDQLKIGIVKQTMLSERRINFFLNTNINKIFPPFLNINQPGLTLALQGLQFVATSTTAQSQSLGYPHSLHSIPTNADNQDIVSMGTDAALLTEKALDNAFTLIAIELATLSQAVACRNSLSKFSNSSKKLIKKVRNVFPVVYEDRSFNHELDELIRLLRT